MPTGVHVDFRILEVTELETSEGLVEAQRVIEDRKLFIERRRSPFGP